MIVYVVACALSMGFWVHTGDYSAASSWAAACVVLLALWGDK